MKRIIAIVCLVIGILILIQGHNISKSVDSQVKQIFTGSPTDKAVYYYIVGCVLIAVGASQLAWSSRK